MFIPVLTWQYCLSHLRTIEAWQPRSAQVQAGESHSRMTTVCKQQQAAATQADQPRSAQVQAGESQSRMTTVCGVWRRFQGKRGSSSSRQRIGAEQNRQ